MRGLKLNHIEELIVATAGEPVFARQIKKKYQESEPEFLLGEVFLTSGPIVL